MESLDCHDKMTIWVLYHKNHVTDYYKYLCIYLIIVG